MVDEPDTWHTTACVLCSNNCGVEVRLDGRRITRVRGNKRHVASKGYTCEKALRIDHYQNNTSRLTSPLRRTEDGGYEEIDWDTAIAEVAAGLQRVVDEHGGDRILYYGGGGQGNHLCGAYGAATRKALGITRRSNALAQEKTGEAWVEGHLFGTHTHGEFDQAEVAVFLGKNPWHSHGFDEARRVLKEIADDPGRSMVVIDPRRTETADLADHFLQVRPGTDAFCVAALAAVLVQEDLAATRWLAEHTVGAEVVLAALQAGSRRGVRAAVRGGGGPHPRCGAPARRRPQRRRVRGPRGGDGAPLHARLLPAAAAVAPRRQLRRAGRHVGAHRHGAAVLLRCNGPGGP